MTQLLEEILGRENMQLAYKKVKGNKGASGIDGITTEEIDEYLKENWVEIREKIRRRKYKPAGEKSRDTKTKWRSTKPGDTDSGR